MAITLTRNLKLKINSSFDDISKYNLNKIDTLASILQINTNEQAFLRSKTDIILEPNSADIGGSGEGGSVTFGSADHALDSITLHAETITFGSSGIGLADTAVGGTRNLLLKYKSDISGSVDTAANRTLSVDLNGSDRNLVLGGNFSLTGANFSINLSSLTGGQVLAYNGDTDTWTNQDPTEPTTSELVATWVPADGATRTITHGFDSYNIEVQIINENYTTIEVDSIVRINTNQLTLTASNIPTGTWTVLIKKVG